MIVSMLISDSSRRRVISLNLLTYVCKFQSSFSQCRSQVFGCDAVKVLVEGSLIDL